MHVDIVRVPDIPTAVIADFGVSFTGHKSMIPFAHGEIRKVALDGLGCLYGWLGCH